VSLLKGKSALLLFLLISSLSLSSQTTIGQTGGAFVPLNFTELKKENDFSIVCFLFPSCSALLEVLIKEEPYVPIRGLALYCGYEVSTQEDSWVISTARHREKNIHLYLKENLLDLAGVKVSIKGYWFPVREEYFMSLNSFQILTGASALWDPSQLEIRLRGLPNSALLEPEEADSKEPTVEHDPFQPVNRLSYLNYTDYSFYTPPDYTNFTTVLSLETGGTIRGGQLSIGGAMKYDFDTHDYNFDLYKYLWKKETDLGYWQLGTVELPYAAFDPYNWHSTGIAYATPDWRPLYMGPKPLLHGQAPTGCTVELWVDDLLYQTKTVEDGEYIFELWLVPRRSHKMRLLIKAGEVLIDEKKWILLPRDNYVKPGSIHFLTSLGFQEKNFYNTYKNLFSSVSELLIGFTDATVGLNLAAIEKTDNSDKILQISEFSNWQLLPNLTFDTRAWFVGPDLGRAGRASLNLGLPGTTLLASYYYQPETFRPVFAPPEEGRVNEYELGAYWQPQRNYLVHLRGAQRDENYQNTTEESLSTRETGMTFPLFSGHTTGLFGKTNRFSVDELKTVNKRTELSWRSGGLSNQRLEFGWTEEEEKTTSKAEPGVEEYYHLDNYWLGVGLGLEADHRYSIYLFSESARENEDKSQENGLSLTFWHKNKDSSYLGLGVGFSARARNAFTWEKWSLHTSYYKEIFPETYFRIAGNYYYEPGSPVGDAESYQISIELDGGFAFTPHGLLPGDKSRSIRDGYISGRVFLDENANGVMDEEEKGVPGIEVSVDDIALATTDAQGRFIFHRIPPGIRRIRINIFTLPLNYRAVNGDVLLTVTAGSTQSVDLGIEIVGSISGRVYIDANKNGLYDQPDQPLRRVKVMTADGRYSAVTGQQGDYYLLLTPGTYRVVLDTSSLPEELVFKENIITITTAAEEIEDLDFPLHK